MVAWWSLVFAVTRYGCLPLRPGCLTQRLVDFAAAPEGVQQHGEASRYGDERSLLRVSRPDAM